MSDFDGFDDDRFFSDVTVAHLITSGESYKRFIEIAMKRRGLVSLAELHEHVGKKFKQPINDYKHFQKNLRSFVGDRRVAVINHIKGVVYAEGASPEADEVNQRLYKTMLTFLGIGATTAEKAPTILRGAYQMWRHSVSVPGYYVKGLILIEKRSESLLATMIQRFQPEATDTHLKNRTDYHHGPIIRQPGGRCVMLLCDRKRHHLRVSFLYGEGGEADRDDVKSNQSDGDFSLRGMVMGVDGGRNFISPLYVERVAPSTYLYNHPALGELRRSLNIYHPEKAPVKVRQFLASQPLMLF